MLPDYRIATVEMVALADSVAGWMLDGLPGGTVCGRQRLGKTSACRVLPELLRERLKAGLFTRFFTIPSTRKDERSLYSDLLQQLEYELALDRDTAKLKSRLIKQLLIDCRKQEADWLVLFIDEAHHLGEVGFEHFVHLQNRLQLQHPKVFVLMIGQLELRDLGNQFLAAEKLEFVGRFFSREFQLRGLALNDVKATLKALDDAGITAEVAPGAHSAGWRALHVAQPLVEAIGELAVRAKVTGEIRVPMQHLNSLYLRLARFAEAKQLPIDCVTKAHVLDGLEQVGYVDVMKLHSAEA